MRNAIKKCLFIVLTCMFASTVWADVTLFEADFTKWSAATYSTPTLVNGVYFDVKNNKTISVGTDGINFNGQNASTGAKGHMVGIHVTGVNGSLTIEITNDYSGKSYKYKVACIAGTDYTKGAPSIADGFSKTLTTTYQSLTGSDYIFWIGEQGTSYKAFKSIKITTPDGGGTTPTISVTGVSLNKTTTTLEIGQTETLTATVAPSDATNQAITWSSNNTSVATVDQNGVVTAISNGTAIITVTTKDGNKTATCTVTVPAPSAEPKVLTATWNNIQGTAVVDNVNLTITGKVKNGTGLTAITPQFTGNNISTWTPVGAQNFSNGAIEYEFSSSTGAMTTYMVTITEAPAMSSDATLKSLTYGGQSVPNFSPATYVYNIELTYGLKTPPTIAAVANDSKANVAITQAGSVPGSGKVVVTAEDGTQLTYTINYTVPVPQSDLSIHVPEVYEAKDIAGGYNGTLTVLNGREYEVYYTTRTADGDYPTFSTTPVSEAKSTGISGSSSKTENVGRPGDKWFKGTIAEHSECKSDKASSEDEFVFVEKGIREHRLSSSNTYQFQVEGYDQFTLWGMDKKLDPKNGNQVFVVKVDGVEQPTDASLYNAASYTIRRYTITSAKHLIEISTTPETGSNKCAFGGFSLRLAQEPRTKWLKGNDSTQVVLQTAAIKPVTYVTKYNNIPGAQTRLQWLGGKEATGIDLQKIEGPLTDTLVLTGNANCATGEYQYAVVAYYNGTETSRATGTFKVASDIQATSDLNVEVYQGEEMDQITFKYYALSADDVKLKWTGTQPTGISGSGNNGKYIIGGTPQTTGSFPFEVSVAGNDTVIKGKITVKILNYGDNSVLYLYKNNLAYDQDAVYNYLKNGGKWNMVERKAKEDGPRPAAQYANYQWVIVSEDADADNAEVMAVVRGSANLPVLNLKGFTYSSDRLNWGEPDNGAIDSTAAKTKGTYLHVLHPQHPIYQAKMNYLKTGDSIQILSNYESKGIMPINVDAPGTLCLGTAYTRDIENYFGAGELQTALHEIPANMRGGHKYICLPLARQVTLSNLGKNLIDGIIAYLTSPNESGIQLPDLQINRFSVAGYDAVIDQNHSTIKLNLPIEEYDNLETAKPIVELADPNTHLVPSVEPSIDLRYAIYIPRTLVVTDYINRRTYELTIETYDPQGIEEVYAAGMWVNVYDIYGRKVTTTNENVYTMELPHGMYIVVMESGQSIKILR